jgi:1-deoxy-D-xylulose-5-phosphate reductoisomerase
MNAANEVAVEAFLNGAISFPRIWGLVEEVMTDHVAVNSPSLEALLEADLEARAAARAGVERVAS